MPITDKKRLRHDVLKIIQERQTFQIQGIAEYVRRPENQEFDFRVLWKKVMAGNTRFFENQGSDEALDRSVEPGGNALAGQAAPIYVTFVSEAIQQIRPLSKEVSIETTVMDGVSAEWQIVAELKSKQSAHVHPWRRVDSGLPFHPSPSYGGHRNIRKGFRLERRLPSCT